MHNKEYSLELTLPALGVIYLKRIVEAKKVIKNLI